MGVIYHVKQCRREKPGWDDDRDSAWIYNGLCTHGVLVRSESGHPRSKVSDQNLVTLIRREGTRGNKLEIVV